ncbi:3-keto-5-aminohexanoate cleavage protein [Clostridium bovifaecis]|uniref:3-keto-5-aminohexanoate cleavage protein n=1 Tax=Clostridium bovifaecis TaxID=2184719 RepID=A0A6I6ERJ2_9CLOT|nr:3-keto-5-aminohexanoate cleavage protein [Clostridium bovifaecis]
MNKPNKRIVTCAITGSIHTPTMSPYLPITPQEIAENAIDAAKAGASVIHIHARNPENGAPSPDLNLFREIIERIREKDEDVIICTTTGGGIGMTVEQRVAVVPEFTPELASLNAGSINWGLFPLIGKIESFKYPWEEQMLNATKNFIFSNTFESIGEMVKIMYENGTKPELEVYDVGHLYNIAFLVNAGILKTPVYLQFVTGILGGIGSTPYDIMNLQATADRLFGKKNYQWSVIGAGKSEFTATTTGLVLGGNVRVGMEDNLYLDKGVLAKSNAELVEKMVRIMNELSLEPATPDEAREILGLK